LRVNNAASRAPEQGGWTVAELAERRAEAWFDPAGLFLASTRPTAGYWAFTGPRCTAIRPTDSARYTWSGSTRTPRVGAWGGPDRRRSATPGRAIVGAAEPTVLLYVESDNAAAVRTYEKLGFTVYSTDTAYAVHS
jgi:mycothiol synthase